MSGGQTPPRDGSRVNEIDLLRFLAALAVVLYHFSFRGYASDDLSRMHYPLLAPAFKYGYLGVELFFMISGFVILMTASKGSLRGFVISRIARLYPAFWACCTLTFAATVAIGEPRYTASPGQYLINMTMLSGFVGVPSIDGAYWSLFVEIGFYVLVGLVLLVGKIHRAQTFLTLWLLASVALELFPVDILRYVLITRYAGFFIAGAVYYLIWSKGLTRERVAIVLVSWWLAVSQSTGALPDFEEDFNTPISGDIVTGIVTFFFGAMLLVSLRRTGWFGRKRWVLAGALTYPVYLLHQHIGYMVFNIAYLEMNLHILFWGTIVGSIVAAYAVHHFVEKKLSSPMKKAMERICDRATQHLRGLPGPRRDAPPHAAGVFDSLPQCRGGASPLAGDGGTGGILGMIPEGHPERVPIEGARGGGQDRN